MRGASAEVKCGYQHAATLGAWTLQPSSSAPITYVFKSTIRDADDFWLSQEPLALVLPVGRTKWMWESITLVRGGSDIRIDLAGKPVIER